MMYIKFMTECMMPGGHVTFHTKAIRGNGIISVFRETPVLFIGVHETDQRALRMPEMMCKPHPTGTRFLAERRPSFRNNQ